MINYTIGFFIAVSSVFVAATLLYVLVVKKYVNENLK